MSIKYKCDDCGKPIAECTGGGSPAPVFCVAWGTRDASHRFIPIGVYDLCEACYRDHASAAFYFRDKFSLKEKLAPTDEEVKEFNNAVKGKGGLDTLAILYGLTRSKGELDSHFLKRIDLCKKEIENFAITLKEEEKKET